MKRIFIIAIALTLAVSAEAQVSVRRTSRNTASTEKTVKQVKEAKENKAAEVKAERDVKVESAAVAEVPAVKKSVAEKKKITTRTQAPSEVEGMSMRRQIFEQNQQRDNYGNRWQTVVYRELDMNIDDNAVLYYPEEPMDGMTNLFRVIFDAFVKGELKGYEYMDGREIFDAKHEVKVQDILETHDIDPSDVPSYQVLSYYVKEEWNFDKNSSQYGPRVLAICPLLHRSGEFGGITRYPLFWINYEDLRPYILDKLVMGAGFNTSVRYTMDDIFTMTKYKGEIYKVQNPRGLTLMQQYPDEAQLKAKRDEIEKQLHEFGRSIWIPEQAEEAPSKEKAKNRLVAKDEQRAAEAETSGKEVVEEDGTVTTKKNRRTGKTAKPKAEKQPKSHSVRR